MTPAKPITHRRPAIDAHALLQDDGGERHGDERRRKRDRGRIRQRKPRERGEVGEHAADAEQAAAKLAERPACAHRGRELAADGIDEHHRQDRESAAEKHHLPDRRDVAELAHQSRHGGKEQSGNQFQADGLEWVHRGLNELPIHTGAAPSSQLLKSVPSPRRRSPPETAAAKQREMSGL